MAYPLLSRCPICDGDLLATRLECVNCHGAVEGEFELGPLGRLNREQANLLSLLVKYRGNMNRVATELGVHYNTVRNRMDELAGAFGFGDSPAEPQDAGQRGRLDVLEQLGRGSLSPEEALARLRGERDEGGQ